MSKNIPQTKNETETQVFRNDSSQTSSQPQSSQNSSHNQVELARKRLLNLEATLNKIVIGHDEAVRALMLALVARQHIALIGPPGTAKTMLVTSVAKLLNAKTYTYLMTKFTTFDEIFGPIDIIALTRGELRRKWSNIVEADIVFLDEIFKAGSAILNSMLSLMQERAVYDPFSGESIPAKLWTLVGASNEVPLDEELQALYDRFALRVFLQYLSDDKLMSAITAKWEGNITPVPLASMDDVKILHEFMITLLQRGRIKELGEKTLKIYAVNTLPLIKALRSKGIIVSDRTVIERLPKLYAASLALYGVTADNVAGAVYEILPYVARTPQEAIEIGKILDESLGEVAELAKKIEQAKALLRADKYEDALKIFKEVAMFDLSRLTSRPWLKPRVEAFMKVAQDYITRIEEHLERARILKEGL
jgi:MoxR-like ATPase